MSAINLIKNLIKLGTIAADAAEKNKKNGKFNYVAFFSETAPDETINAVRDIMNSITQDELKTALELIEQKQKNLLSERQVHELNTDELVQYSALTDAKLLLKTAILKRSVEGDFFKWLVDEGGLANIIKIAKIILPLLV